MSVVIPFAWHRRLAVPPLLFVEMLDHQLHGPGAHRAEDVRLPLANCALLLEHARSRDWPVGIIFSSPSENREKEPHLTWIDGFQPRRADMIFEMDGDSGYASAEFSDAITNAGNCFLIAGFSGETICLATLIDAVRDRHAAALVEDATCVRQMRGLDVPESRRALAAIARNYATVLTAQEWLRSGGALRPKREPSFDRV